MKIKTPIPRSPDERTAHLVTKVTVTDETSKEVVHEEESTRRVPVVGGGAMKIRYIESIKISRNFQSIGLEVGFVEYPVVDGQEPSDAFAEASALVEEELVAKTTELEGLLLKLSAKKK